MNYNYDVKFEENILIVGRIGCGKTTFVQNLGKNKMFGEIKEVIWVSKMPLSKDRESNLRGCFVDEEMDFKYQNNIDEFDDWFDYFQRQGVPCNKNFVGENIKLDRLIVTDDVWALLINQKNLLFF